MNLAIRSVSPVSHIFSRAVSEFLCQMHEMAVFHFFVQLDLDQPQILVKSELAPVQSVL